MARAIRISTFTALVLGGIVLGGGSALALDDPSGYWATEKHESQIKIFHCGQNSICGTIFWMREPNDKTGVLRTDKENEDEAKRKRPLLGLQLINMKPDDDEWKGTVYNPQNGKTYSATLKHLSKTEIELKGCVAYVLCGGQTWTKEEPKQTNTASTMGAAGAHPATKPETGKPADTKPADTKPAEDE